MKCIFLVDFWRNWFIQDKVYTIYNQNTYIVQSITIIKDEDLRL